MRECFWSLTPGTGEILIMKFDGFNILKILVKKREMTYGEFYALLPKKFKDHRDCYIFASLVEGGYVGHSLRKDKNFKEIPRLDLGNYTLAEQFYINNLSKGSHEYNGIKILGKADFGKSEKVFCTAKADLYFAELEEKRRDRLSTLWIGITVAIVAASVTHLLGYIIAKCSG